MKRSLEVVNAATARFECVFPSCGGACCKESRPPVSSGEERRIAANLARFLPDMRPAARAIAERGEWITRRVKRGRPTLAVLDRYCVFYREGCALHRAGAAEGDKNKYKPSTCITFPLDRDDHDRWYIRQRGVENEEWDLHCLDPESSPKKGIDTLADELEHAARVAAGLESWRTR